MTIEQLVSVLNNVEVKGDVNKEIEFITHDSRRVRKNTLFVSKGNHDTLVGRNLLSQLVYHSFTEKESGRVVKNEIIHNLYWVFYCLERKDRVFSLSLIKILANERKTRKIQSIKGCERSRLWSLSGWRR